MPITRGLERSGAFADWIILMIIGRLNRARSTIVRLFRVGRRSERKYQNVDPTGGKHEESA
ncbi:MAG: hypothetical protein M1368_12470 [Thaumarchaeota archaeon]|nr:hypothetical protein [Nitrososphaerota archaeon]